MKTTPATIALEHRTKNFYRKAIEVLQEEDVPFLLGGAFALNSFTGITRDTKDLDIFIRPGDVESALAVLRHFGLQTELTDPVWLAKAFSPERKFIDLIFRSGNGIGEVDDEWFKYSSTTSFYGVPVNVCPPEETIWSKAFVMERHRFDGADIAHYLLACAPRLDWRRLIRRFGENWRVLFTHLTLFGFIYPEFRNTVPLWVMQELADRIVDEHKRPAPSDHICRGTLLSRYSYVIDLKSSGCKDARFENSSGTLDKAELRRWKKRMADEAKQVLRDQAAENTPPPRVAAPPRPRV